MTLWACAASCCFLFPSHNPIVSVVSWPRVLFCSPHFLLCMPSFIFYFLFARRPIPDFAYLPASHNEHSSRASGETHSRCCPPDASLPAVSSIGLFCLESLPCLTSTRCVCECPCSNQFPIYPNVNNTFVAGLFPCLFSPPLRPTTCKSNLVAG